MAGRSSAKLASWLAVWPERIHPGTRIERTMSLTGEADAGTLAENTGASDRSRLKSSSIPFSIGAASDVSAGMAVGAEKSSRATRRTGCPESATAGLGIMIAEVDSATMMRKCDTRISSET